MSDYFVFIDAEMAFFPIEWMCRKLKVARASYYRWFAPAAPTPTQVRHCQLEEAVLRVFEREKGKAGRDLVTLMLKLEGSPIAAGAVGAIMVANGRQAVRMRAWKKKTTTADPAARTERIVNHMLDSGGRRDFVPRFRAPGSVATSRICAPGQGGHRHRSDDPDGGRLVDGLPHAHVPDHRRHGHGARPRTPDQGRDLSQ